MSTSFSVRFWGTIGGISVVAVAAFWLAACASGPPEDSEHSTRQEAESAPAPREDDESPSPDVEPRNYSDVITFQARLEIGPGGPPGSKAAESTVRWLIRDDGEKWLVATEKDLSAYDGARVRVTGRSFEPSPYVAHIGATHFELQSIERVEGTTE